MLHLKKILLFCFFCPVIGFAQLLPVREGTLWGYADYSGNLVVPTKFHDANFFAENMGRVRLNGLYGYINTQGQTVIPHIYINASDFSGGLALVTDTSNIQHFINKEGIVVLELPENIALAEPFQNGLSKISRFKIERKIIKEKGKGKSKAFIPSETIKENSSYSMGFMDTLGKIIIEPSFDDLSDFDASGVARFMRNGKMGLIMQNGTVILKEKYNYIGPFCEDLAIAKEGDDYGYINRKGNWVIKPRFENGGDFSDGLAPVTMGKQWGYINHEGKFLINPIFDFAESFSEGMAGIVLGRKWGMINTKGEMTIRNIFQDYAPFRDGLAAVKLKEGWGYIDQTGNMVILPQYNIAGSFVDGISMVETDNEAMYIQKNGSIIYKWDVASIKKLEKKREYYWQNAELKYEKEASEYLKSKKKKGKQ